MMKNTWRKRLLWLLVLIGVLGGSYTWWSKNQAAHAARESLPVDSSATVEAGVVMVTAAPVMLREVQRTVEAVGTLYGFEEVTISAKVEGRVKKLHHDVSDRVKPGELLIELDPTDHELAVRQSEKSLHVETARMGVQEPPSSGVDVTQLPPVIQATIKLQTAKQRLERVQAAGDAISKEDLADKQAEVRLAESEYRNQILQMRTIWATVLMKQEALAMSQQQLKDTKVFAATPLSSLPLVSDNLTYVITHRPVAEGSFVRVGTELCKLAIDQTLKLRLPIPERYGSEVKLGQKTLLQVAAHPQMFEGKITRINPSVESATRTFEVEVQVPNSQGLLKPGGFAKAFIQTKKDPQATVVPLSALVTFAGINKVFLIDQGQAKAVPVTLGVQSNEWVEITSPRLPEKAQVITSGQTALAEGSKVIVREKK